MRLTPSIVALLLALSSGPAVSLGTAPAPVSPGGPLAVVNAGQPCPTFIWGAVDRASSYQLAVFELQARDEAGLGDQDLHAEPVLRVEIDAPATAWAPGADECLKPGRRYAWTVRETPSFGAHETDWSLPLLFRVPDPEELAALSGAPATRVGTDPQEDAEGGLATRSNPGNSGNAGPPGVLAAIAELSELVQLQNLQLGALINQRADTLEAQLGVNEVVDPEHGGTPSLASRIASLQAGLLPCTPEKLAEGRCDDNHPLDLEVTICANVGTGAGLNASYQVAPTGHLHAGAGWSLAADVSAVAQLDIPLMLGPIPLPTLGLGADAGVRIGADGCLGGIRIPIGKSLEAELLHIVAGITEGAEELTVHVANAASDLQLGVARVGDGLELLHSLRDGTTEIGPFFSSIRSEVQSALPLGSRVEGALSEVENVVAQITGGVDCSSLEALGIPDAGEICSFLDGQAALEELAVAFAALQNVGDTLSGLGNQIQTGFNNVLSDLSPLDNILSIAEDICEAVDNIPGVSCSL